MDIRVLSAGTALPGPPVSNAALAARFGMDTLWEQWVDAFIGTRHRHLALDLETGGQEHSLADLGTEAGREALARAEITPSEVDLVVLSTATPDALMPATVNVIADRLGIDGVTTLQLQAGCSGAVQALDTARQLLLAGRHRTALVLGGEVLARFYDLSADLGGLPPEQLVNFVLFGDGAGAAVLTTRDVPGAVSLVTSMTRLEGLGHEPGATLEWFGPVDRDSGRVPASEDYKAIERRVPLMAGATVDGLLDELDWKDSEVDYLLPPQLSGRMSDRISRHLADHHGLAAAHTVNCVDETGNNGNGLVYFQLERALDRLAEGDRALGVSIESSKWIRAGFALERR
ncbi:3-oxoacyl-ACP synthase III family protein [Amycolatopsis sp., V23-08]|uniref:3-oxoacyl-ACP synthase III family protein n=1 Tax=Amycolatopsis heterodermiae TaxID=3110235 RepID=A0ABU5R2C5_9PSEU|nr:3-oxoacyl-ACP synthase III family protein [Amycolatopsis sp., V23-08]MEA5360361.1 3-oxoacyl-ACP synthase III family protein [Amycolatopsis sp., V23-08]